MLTFCTFLLGNWNILNNKVVSIKGNSYVTEHNIKYVMITNTMSEEKKKDIFFLIRLIDIGISNVIIRLNMQK